MRRAPVKRPGSGGTDLVRLSLSAFLGTGVLVMLYVSFNLKTHLESERHHQDDAIVRTHTENNIPTEDSVGVFPLMHSATVRPSLTGMAARAYFDEHVGDLEMIKSSLLNSKVKREAFPAVWPLPVKCFRDLNAPQSQDAFISSQAQIVLKGRALLQRKRSVTEIMRRMSALNLFEAPTGTQCDGYFDTVIVEVEHDDPDPEMTTENEGYELVVGPQGALVRGRTVWGALHGLKTLSQLVTEKDMCPRINDLPMVIKDEPRFSHRGFLLDTAHHFKPVDWINDVLFFVSAAKMNVFHWHMTDHQNWGVDLPGAEFLSHKSKSYSEEEIQSVVKRGHDLGVMILPEIDVPGKALALEGTLPISVFCRSKDHARKFPNCDASLDPTSEDVYAAIDRVIHGLLKTFPAQYLHLGGEEVCYTCWRTKEFSDWVSGEGAEMMKIWGVAEKLPDGQSPIDVPHRLWELFERRLNHILESHDLPWKRNVIRWQEYYEPQMSACCGDKHTAIQFWRDPMYSAGKTIMDAIKSGYHVIASPELGWYLDPQVGDRYWRTWMQRWLMDPTTVYPTGMPAHKLPDEMHPWVLGGEVGCWARCLESQEMFDSYFWIPTAAIAERFWSEESVRDIPEAKRRFYPFIDIMEKAGYNVGDVEFHERRMDNNAGMGLHNKSHIEAHLHRYLPRTKHSAAKHVG